MEDGSFESAMVFRDSKGVIGTLEMGAALALLVAAGDIALALDENGVISDIAISAEDMPDLSSWIGRPWLDTVAVDSRPKISEMLADADQDDGQPQRWRQVNHPGPEGNLPIHYRLLSIGDGSLRMAIGRDVRPWAALQQRLLQTQQSLERDYLRLRQTEARYRTLFEIMRDPVLIVDAANRRIVEANPACHHLLGLPPGSIEGRPLSSLVDDEARDSLVAYLGRAEATAEPGSIALTLDGSDAAPLQVSAVPFSQDGKKLFFVRFGSPSAAPASSPFVDLVAAMPDGFVLTDKDLNILAANDAFATLVEAVSPDALVGEPLGRYIGRPGIDLDLIRKQLDTHGSMRNVTTVAMIGSGHEEPIEVSGVYGDNDGGRYGLVVRSVARRVRDLPPPSRDLPRSVDQLTELVGRMPLKEIVRESTDLIERTCIEAALAYTADNRASAAEILGLSRQSLYSKLHRHGLGNLADRREG